MCVYRQGSARVSAPARTDVPRCRVCLPHRAVLGGSARASVRVLPAVRWCLRGCRGSSDRVCWIPGGFRCLTPKPLSGAQAPRATPSPSPGGPAAPTPSLLHPVPLVAASGQWASPWRKSGSSASPSLPRLCPDP